jgi:hypothetical protein
MVAGHAYDAFHISLAVHSYLVIKRCTAHGSAAQHSDENMTWHCFGTMQHYNKARHHYYKRHVRCTLHVRSIVSEIRFETLPQSIKAIRAGLDQIHPRGSISRRRGFSGRSRAGEIRVLSCWLLPGTCTDRVTRGAVPSWPR